VLGLQDVQPLSIETPALDHVGVISTFIRLDAHRRGIGRTLADATFDAAARQGFEKLVATVRADHPVAIAFYESLGFRPVGVAARHARIRGRLIDEVILECFIFPD
jgi:L-amino acid N-acyltransferase YncA